MIKLLLTAIFFPTSLLFGEPLAIVLPPETVEYRQMPGVELAQSFCMGCHSADYVLTQPPNMPRKFWESEVLKMKNIFGAPIPDDQVQSLADYLVRSNASPRKK